MFQGQRALDELNRTLLITGLVCSILGTLLFRDVVWARTALSVLASACLVFAVIRLLGGRPERRNAENMRFLTVVTGVKEWFAGIGRRLSGVFGGKDGAAKATRQPKPRRAYKARKNPTWAEIRQYKYFICPQCTQRLRVPRGKGKLRVTCTKCGNVFETKS